MNYPHLISSLNKAISAKKSKTIIKYSKKSINFLKVLKEINVISGYIKENNNCISIYFQIKSYSSKTFSIKNNVKSCKLIYFSVHELKKFEFSIIILILNTSSGILTHKMALNKGIGGNLLAIIN